MTRTERHVALRDRDAEDDLVNTQAEALRLRPDASPEVQAGVAAGLFDVTQAFRALVTPARNALFDLLDDE